MVATIFIVLGILYLIAFIVASKFSRREEKETEVEDYTYVKPKVIPHEYDDTEIQEKKKVFEECLRKGMKPIDALCYVKDYSNRG